MNKITQLLDDRLRLKPLREALSRSRPRDHVPLSAAPPFSLGRLTLALILLLAVSGLGLTFFYNPTAEGAASSLAFLHTRTPLGWLVHNTHRWSALLLIVVVVLHALRNWLQLTFRKPRDLNWWMGLILLVILVVMGGTGYILRWDIKAFTLMDLVVSNLSSVPVAGPTLVTILLGGTELDVIPLHRGYALHVWFLPFALMGLVALHLIVSWRQGLSERSMLWERWKAKLPLKRWTEVIPGLGLLILVVILSALTPHEIAAEPVDRFALPHPDWLLTFYLLPFWFFQGPTRIIGALVIPLLLLASLALAPVRVKDLISRSLRIGLAAAGVIGVLWLLGQTAYMGSQIPLGGCNACHRDTIIGGAPMDLSEFDIQDPDWIIGHLKDPLRSVFEPYPDPIELP